MGRYLLYTGIIIFVWGLICSIFFFFYFEIKNTFFEWRFIKRSEMGQVVRGDMASSPTLRRRKKKQDTLDSEELTGNTSSYTLETLSTVKTETPSNLAPKPEPEPIQFGQNIVEAGMTEVLSDDEEDEEFIVEQPEQVEEEIKPVIIQNEETLKGGTDTMVLHNYISEETYKNMVPSEAEIILANIMGIDMDAEFDAEKEFAPGEYIDHSKEKRDHTEVLAEEEPSGHTDILDGEDRSCTAVLDDDEPSGRTDVLEDEDRSCTEILEDSSSNIKPERGQTEILSDENPFIFS